MAEQKLPLRANQLLLPTLFDRLRDDAPNRRTELPNEFTLTREQLRDIIQRDLAFLFNSISKEDILNVEKYPEIARSTLNYGMPALAGKFHTEYSWDSIQARLTKAIHTFEPRILPDTLQIIPQKRQEKDYTEKSYNTLSFKVYGRIYCNPYPLEFVVQSAVDLETNRINIKSINVK